MTQQKKQTSFSGRSETGGNFFLTRRENPFFARKSRGVTAVLP